jgi:hypothetical protein
VGWGGLANPFPDPMSGEYKDQWSERGPELCELLTDEEYKAARRSTRDAHYTSQGVASAITLHVNDSASPQVVTREFGEDKLLQASKPSHMLGAKILSTDTLANGRTGERANGRTGERANGRTGERANGRTGERGQVAAEAGVNHAGGHRRPRLRARGRGGAEFGPHARLPVPSKVRRFMPNTGVAMVLASSPSAATRLAADHRGHGRVICEPQQWAPCCPSIFRPELPHRSASGHWEALARPNDYEAAVKGPRVHIHCWVNDRARR